MIEERDLIRHLREGGTDVWDPPAPPPLDLAAIVGEAPTDEHAALDAGPDPFHDPVPRRTISRPTWWRRLTGPSATVAPRPMALVGGAGACVAVGVLAGAVLFGGDGPQPDPSPRSAPQVATAGSTPAFRRQVTLGPLEDAPSSASAVARITSRTPGQPIDVRVSGMPTPARGQFYELWALGTKGRMASLGTITVGADGTGHVTTALPVSLVRFPVLDISLERADGNPAHSGRSLMRAPV